MGDPEGGVDGEDGDPVDGAEGSDESSPPLQADASSATMMQSIRTPCR
jgi:hypothetical protein